MSYIVLVEPEQPENTGFIARLAANFEYDLKIVNPEFNLKETRTTANKAQNKIREAEIHEDLESAIKNINHLIGTKPGKGKALKNTKPRKNTSIMIGRESNGLTNKELEKCQRTVQIETSENYKSINQSHAAAILMHHFSENHSSEEKAPNKEQFKFLEKETGNEKLVELIARSDPSQDELNHLIGELKQK